MTRGRPPMTERNNAVLELAGQGLWAAEIARRLNLDNTTVWYVLHRFNVVPARKPKIVRDMPRVEKMAAMYRQGITLEKIGQQFDVTRERVRQLLRKVGVGPTEGGQCRTTAITRQGEADRRDAASIARWGFDAKTIAAHRDSGILGRFKHQQKTAAMRGIAWKLTFHQWLTIWEQSGKLALRGRGKGHYVMSRVADEGGYTLGNVHIQLSTDNNSQGRKKSMGNRATFTGVWRLYPGSPRPWVAKIGEIRLGVFATEAEAAAARQAYIEATPGVKFIKRAQMSQPAQSC